MTDSSKNFINLLLNKLNHYLDNDFNIEVLPYLKEDLILIKYNKNEPINLLIKLDHINDQYHIYVDCLLKQIQIISNDKKINDIQESILELILWLNFMRDLDLTKEKDQELINTYLKRIKLM